MLMCILNLVRFCPFVLKILSRNKILTSIKGHNSVKILRNIKGYNPKLDLVISNVHTKFGQLLSIKGSNSVKILRKMTGNNPQLEPVNVDVHKKFGQIMSIRSQDIERKRNSKANQGQ